MSTSLLAHFVQHGVDAPRSKRPTANRRDITAKIASVPLTTPCRHQGDDADGVTVPREVAEVGHGHCLKRPKRRRSLRSTSIRKEDTVELEQVTMTAGSLDDGRESNIHFCADQADEPRNGAPKVGGLWLVERWPTEQDGNANLLGFSTNLHHGRIVLKIRGQQNGQLYTLLNTRDSGKRWSQRLVHRSSLG